MRLKEFAAPKTASKPAPKDANAIEAETIKRQQNNSQIGVRITAHRKFLPRIPVSETRALRIVHPCAARLAGAQTHAL